MIIIFARNAINITNIKIINHEILNKPSAMTEK
jgi:hypothetical protein